MRCPLRGCGYPWDLRGKTLRRPVYDLLGGSPDATMACYATGRDVADYLDLGFDSFKLPCPWGPDRDLAIAETVDMIASTRELIGEADLMLDGWALLDLDAATAIARAVEPFGLHWFEDALHPDDLFGYAMLRERIPGLRVAAGERWFTERPFRAVAEQGSVDVVQPDALWVGGATPTVRIAALAAENDIELSIHCGANDSYGQHLCFALCPDSRAELYIESSSPGALHTYRSTPGMSVPHEGRIAPNDAPGFGIELTLDDIDRAT